ncbi:MAG: DUF4397 domain-containing protein [Gammaproteobacteria bacterium]|nr:DUF4397 domain-containing protein [Gammaproteobacteria bacterium]
MSGWIERIRRLRCVGLVLAVALLSAGCAETQRPEATGKGAVRGINAIVTSPELGFLNEERRIGNVNFRGTVGFREWDDLDYTFSFDLLLPGESDGLRLASQYIDVVKDTQYSIALVGTLDDASIVSWEEPQRAWTGTEIVFESDFVHLSPMTGQVDVYYAVEGTPPVVGNEVGTMSFGERLPYREFPEGDYELTLTAPGDPSTVLYLGTATRQSPARRVTVALFDPDRSVTAPVSVNVILPDGSAVTPSDQNSPAQLRLLNTLFGAQNVDGYFDGDFGAAVFPDVAFAELSAYTDLVNPNTTLTVTEAGAPANVVIEQEIQTINNTFRMAAVFADAGEVKVGQYLNESRPVSTFPLLRVTDFADNVDTIDIYEREAGTVIDDTVFPAFGRVTVGLTSGYFATREGMRELTVTAQGEKTPIATPLVLDLVDGQIVDLIIVDTADPAVLEIRVLESVTP